jgi:prepilin-type N-terminal cleavage/methylation domain-containing protein
MTRRVLKGPQGFTLVELMVVVAIVGILVAVAIPNFLTYQARAKQAEVKTILGGTFVAATAVFYSEQGTYIMSQISDLSFSPIGTPRYSYWFPVNGITPTAFPGGSTATGPCNVNSSPAGVVATATSFTAGARGNIDTDAACDDWLINENKILTNTNDDVAR